MPNQSDAPSANKRPKIDKKRIAKPSEALHASQAHTKRHKHDVEASKATKRKATKRKADSALTDEPKDAKDVKVAKHEARADKRKTLSHDTQLGLPKVARRQRKKSDIDCARWCMKLMNALPTLDQLMNEMPDVYTEENPEQQSSEYVSWRNGWLQQVDNASRNDGNLALSQMCILLLVRFHFHKHNQFIDPIDPDNERDIQRLYDMYGESFDAQQLKEQLLAYNPSDLEKIADQLFIYYDKKVYQIDNEEDAAVTIVNEAQEDDAGDPGVNEALVYIKTKLFEAVTISNKAIDRSMGMPSEELTCRDKLRDERQMQSLLVHLKDYLVILRRKDNVQLRQILQHIYQFDPYLKSILLSAIKMYIHMSSDFAAIKDFYQYFAADARMPIRMALEGAINPFAKDDATITTFRRFIEALPAVIGKHVLLFQNYELPEHHDDPFNVMGVFADNPDAGIAFCFDKYLQLIRFVDQTRKPVDAIKKTNMIELLFKKLIKKVDESFLVGYYQSFFDVLQIMVDLVLQGLYQFGYTLLTQNFNKLSKEGLVKWMTNPGKSSTLNKYQWAHLMGLLQVSANTVLRQKIVNIVMDMSQLTTISGEPKLVLNNICLLLHGPTGELSEQQLRDLNYGGLQLIFLYIQTHSNFLLQEYQSAALLVDLGDRYDDPNEGWNRGYREQGRLPSAEPAAERGTSRITPYKRTMYDERKRTPRAECQANAEKYESQKQDAINFLNIILTRVRFGQVAELISRSGRDKKLLNAYETLVAIYNQSSDTGESLSPDKSQEVIRNNLIELERHFNIMSSHHITLS